MKKGGRGVKHKHAVLLTACVVVFTFLSNSFAFVEWDIRRTLKLKKSPIDVAVSGDGKWIFVLTDQGKVQVFAADGTLKDEIPVGIHADGITLGPREGMLLVSSRKEKTVKDIRLDFIHDIDVSGAPFKGPTDAPVVIAVFSEFQ
jgi:hypothetical protein